ncbi:MAG: Glyoxalase/Bleomycin resistance protein/Dioxygenase superfamily protein [Syntrophorhabdaceae bacterium PtaU1.Bin034]|jgi:methylmalonyl-CoA/ethylmalonyl-CoA epimerase|nr:MAG: Glyoxalase/Bleomycin resistance protein/Dioxygenase superfamily protein [Syntrophorhabdaceae bacterium PtaU1.Bin034]
MKIQKIDHICFAVKDLERTKQIYRDSFQLVPEVEYIAESEYIKVARYYIGEVAVEFMESTSPKGEVAKFIDKRGEGVFLISYKVGNLDEALSELKAKGAQLIDQEPRELFGNRYAFVQRPDKLCGILTELLDGDFDKSQVPPLEK